MNHHKRSFRSYFQLLANSPPHYPLALPALPSHSPPCSTPPRSILAAQYGIVSFPTLHLFSPAHTDPPLLYHGFRSSASITAALSAFAASNGTRLPVTPSSLLFRTAHELQMMRARPSAKAPFLLSLLALSVLSLLLSLSKAPVPHSPLASPGPGGSTGAAAESGVFFRMFTLPRWLRRNQVLFQVGGRKQGGMVGGVGGEGGSEGRAEAVVVRGQGAEGVGGREIGGGGEIVGRGGDIRRVVLVRR
ncbi:unnamed protein product [Closterium sp. NIES-54]